MKLSIQFEEGDYSSIKKAKFSGGAGEPDELAATIFTLVRLSDLSLEWVIASLLNYSDESCLQLNIAIKKYLSENCDDATEDAVE